MSQQATVLFDAPGPRTRRRNLLIGTVATLVIVAALASVLWALRDQYAPSKFAVLFTAETWQFAIIPGLMNTLQAAAISIVTAIVLGGLLGLGRLSDFAPVRLLCTIIVEFFRAVPVLIMMIFTWLLIVRVLLPLGVPLQGPVASLVAVITGLTMYNSSVIAELLRSGMHSLPRGQREAGLAIGLSNSQTRVSVLLPQAITAMLPSLVSQLVVILKDSALGYIVLYPELLRALSNVASNNANTIASFTLAAALFIAINIILTWVAGQVQRRLSKRGGGTVEDITQGAGIPTAT